MFSYFIIPLLRWEICVQSSWNQRESSRLCSLSFFGDCCKFNHFETSNNHLCNQNSPRICLLTHSTFYPLFYQSKTSHNVDISIKSLISDHRRSNAGQNTQFIPPSRFNCDNLYLCASMYITGSFLCYSFVFFLLLHFLIHLQLLLFFHHSFLEPHISHSISTNLCKSIHQIDILITQSPYW